VVVKVCPKRVVVPTPVAGEAISKTRCAGFVVSDASRNGAALKICRPLETRAAKAMTQSQWLARVAIV